MTRTLAGIRTERVVWLVDPAKKTVTVHRRGAPPRVFDVSDDLDGDDVLPGFRLKVAEIFAR